MDLQLDGKATIVFGAGGIGQPIAQLLAQEGARVAICDLGVDHLKRASRSIREITGKEVLWFRVDAAHSQDVDETVKKIKEALGSVDILVNCAGSTPFGPFLQLDDAHWLEAINSKLMLYVRFIRAVVPHMIKAGGGRIISVIGISGKRIRTSHLAGGSVNAALALLTSGLAVELAPHHILVNALNPGPAGTDRLEQRITAMMKESGLNREEVIQKIVEDIPLGRYARPEEVAGMVAFLASKWAGFITGTCITIDGGESRGPY